MFNNIMPFGIKDKLLIGKEVPSGAVNIAHFNSNSLDSKQNLIISDNSSSVIENVEQQQDIIMYTNENNQLVLINPSKGDEKFNEQNIENIVSSELIMLTDKFKDDVPLYYRYKLKYYFFDDNINLNGEYNGDSIILVDKYNKEILQKFKYKIILKSTEIENLYTVYIYTSFVIENNYNIKCIYNGAEYINKQIVIHNALEEYINPQIFYKKATSILEMKSKEDFYYIRKSNKKIRSSEIFVDGWKSDPRKPQRINISAKIEFEDGKSTTIEITENGVSEHCIYNKKSILPEEEKNFINDKQILTTKTIKELCGEKKNIISVDLKITHADRNKENISLYTKPDGTGVVLAKTTVDTGKYSTIPDKYYVKNNSGFISCGYAIKFKDRNPIKILYPREQLPLENWYIRIQNGMFTCKNNGKLCTYYIPEYYTQYYSEKFGKPYKDIKKESPLIISNKSIKLKNTPLFILQDENGIPNNINIYKIDAHDNKWSIKIDSWNDKDGIINLKDNLSENDNILVDYTFEEQTYVYRGYFDNENFMLLDCNPNKNHYLTSTTNGVIDIPTFNYIDGMIYVYMRPALIEEQDEGGNVIPKTRIHNNKVLFHTMEKLSTDVINNEFIILIGVIYIRPNSSFYNLNITDTRTRGGGVLEEIDTNLRKELEPESDFYWDIGYWDGEQYPNNSVIVVRLDKKILSKHGGRFTEAEVEDAVNKHAAYGTLILIEYVDTFAANEYKIDNADIKIEHINKLNFTPEMFLTTESVIKAEFVDLCLDRGVEDYKPQIVTITDDKLPEDPIILGVNYEKRTCDIAGLSIDSSDLDTTIVDTIIYDESEEIKPALKLDTEYGVEHYKPGLYLDAYDENVTNIEKPKLVDLIIDDSKYKPEMTLSSFIADKKVKIVELIVSTEKSKYERLLKPNLFLTLLNEKEK